MACLIGVMVLTTVGCVTTGPKFSPEIQQSYRDHDMRQMQTDHLEVYYPEHRRDEARQVAGRLEECLQQLNHELPRIVDWGPVPVFLPEVEFNNAYAAFGAGEAPYIVMPTFFTANFFGEFGYTPSVSAVGCHEMVHYVHFTQIHGFYRAFNRLFGPSVNPQIGLDLWFFEGLATYYESQLVDGVGRYGSPIWEQTFAAGVAGQQLDGGWLSELNREIPFGAHYLVGSHFVGYLVDEYGEQRLWELIDHQGASLAFPLGVGNRFQAVYGARLNELIDEFSQHLGDKYRPQERPDGQRRQRWVGRSAMLESGPDDQYAVFSSDIDRVAAIEIFDDDGKRRLRREIPDLLPGRELVTARGIEAMRFGADGEELFFLATHRGRDHLRTSLMRLDIETNQLQMVRDDIRAVGGDLSADGDGFIGGVIDGDRVRFIRFGWEQSDDEELFALPRGAYVGWIRRSPDGDRLATTMMEDDRWSVVVFDAQTGAMLNRWSTGRSQRPVFDPHWIDDSRLLFVASVDDGVQVVEGGVDDDRVRRRTQAPYMAYNPRPDGDGGIRFLNREDWGWTLDQVQQPAQEISEEVRHEQRGDIETSPPMEATGYELSEPAHVYDDSAYSMLDGLFVPRMRAPMLFVEGLGEEIEVSLGLAGRDELGFHNWLVDARWDFGRERLSGTIAYVNTQLAPWTATAQVASQWQTSMTPVDDDATELVAHSQRDRVARLQWQRPWYDTPVSLEASGAEILRPQDRAESGRATRLIGAEMGAEYDARRSTSHGGAQWRLGLSGRAGGYPAQIGSNFSMAHLRSQIDVHTPLPLSSRHRLQMSARTRVLPGVPDERPLMRIGGFNTFQPLHVTGDAETQPLDTQGLPPGFLFVEPLRGYEDMGLVANRVGIADINYRYPLVIDRGAASIAGLVPAVFLREFDIQAFASGATRFDGQLHGAFGASIDTAFSIWRLPFRLRTQLARRLFDDEQFVFSVSLGAGFGF